MHIQRSPFSSPDDELPVQPGPELDHGHAGLLARPVETPGRHHEDFARKGIDDYGDG